MKPFVVNIEASKSIVNRKLIISYLKGESLAFSDQSSAEDVQVLRRILEDSKSNIWDVGHTGTAFRFLTALACLEQRDIVITGSARLKERPISQLVDLLRAIGAKIDYIEKENFAPLRISPSKLSFQNLDLPLMKSSQFISALLLIAPFMHQGLKLNIHPNQGSKSYIQMTLDLLQKEQLDLLNFYPNIELFPVLLDHPQLGNSIPKIESDWSSASYWFAMALVFKADIQIDTFYEDSLQGDAVLVSLFKTLGLDSSFDDGILKLTNQPANIQYFEYDFSSCPDLCQTLLVLCLILQIDCQFTGLESLAYKETNRLLAIETEFEKLGNTIEISEHFDELNFSPKPIKLENQIDIETYQDHRMAMAFSPLVLMFPEKINIKNPEVVNKSYPKFWSDFERFKTHLNSP
ncbi:MAG: 3-phosphoshikimate 1-carboxyvinyltransferase [Flavobacteriales bacterium]